MTVLNSSYKFISCIWNNKKTTAIVPESEDDIKLQNELKIMLSSLEVPPTKDEQDVSLQEALYGLIEKIHQASLRTLNNQSVDPSARLQRQLDVASLGGLVDRMNKRRLADQEWVSNAEQLKQDINELVAKSACFFNVQEEYNEQRYEMSPIKERDLYLFQIFGKIDRQRNRRMTNQDATKPKRNCFEDDAMISLINDMQIRSTKYTEQRATLRRVT